MLRIVYRIDDGDDFFLCGNDRQFLIKAEKRNLPPVPVLVKNVVIEIPQLTDKNVVTVQMLNSYFNSMYCKSCLYFQPEAEPDPIHSPGKP